MTATGHAVIGVVIAAKIGNPVFAIPIAIASHAVADMIPHWDTATHRHEKSKRELWIHTVADVMLSVLISYILVAFLFPQTSLLYAYLIVFFAQALDWFTAPYLFLDMKFPFSYFHRFQLIFDRKLDKPWGIILQVAVLTLFVIIAKLN